MKQTMTRIAGLRSRALVLPVLAVFAAAGCDTSVTNPGPVQDAFLDSLNAHQAIINGASRNLSDALDQIAYWGAALTYEINPAGSTGSFGIPTQIQDGRIDRNFSGDWENAVLARFTSEDALRRFQEVLPKIPGAPAFGSYDLAGEAALLAGYANRLFGENFCQVVYDGGAAQPFSDALTRAEQHFTDAMNIAASAGDAATGTAAQAGRASVRAYLATYNLGPGWAQAAADANAVPNSFVFQAEYSDQDQGQGNYVMIASPGLGTYRAHTTWGTFYEDYFRQNPLDTRTPWVVGSNAFGDAAVTKFGGNVTFLPQDKYDDPEDGIDLSTGWEMRLIEAEAALASSGNFAAADGFMNQRRANLGLVQWTAGNGNASTSVAQAYTRLKGERALETWIEARRMGDLRRWQENNVSGGLADVWDGVYGTGTAVVAGVGQSTAVGVIDTQLTTLATNARCWPIGDSEFDTNTNISR